MQTNIVIFDVSGTGRTAAEISAALAKRNVLANPTGKHAIRMVTHCDVDRPAIDRALARIPRPPLRRVMSMRIRSTVVIPSAARRALRAPDAFAENNPSFFELAARNQLE